jgi:hypothetical protein
MRGGYSVYRVVLHDSTIKTQTVDRLMDLGALVEHDGNLIAMAVPNGTDLDVIVDYILGRKAKCVWGAQDGYVFEEASQ